MINKILIFSVLLSATATAWALAATNSTQPAPMLVSGTDIQISADDFVSLANAQSAALRNSINMDPAERRKFLDKLINMNLMAREAKRRGYGDHPEVFTVKKNRLAALMKQNISDRYTAVSPTEAQLRTYYDNHEASYNQPARVRARHILISDKTKAQRMLDKLLSEKVSKLQFRRLAQTESEDDRTASRGGDLGFFDATGNRANHKKPVSAQLVSATFAISENGRLSNKLIETTNGFHIVMRIGYRNSMHLSFEDARPRLVDVVKKHLHQQAIDNAISALESEYKVRLFEENLKHVVIDLSKKQGNTGTVIP